MSKLIKAFENGQWTMDETLSKGGSKCELCSKEGVGDHHGEFLCESHLKMREQGKGPGKTLKEIKKIPSAPLPKPSTIH